MKCRILLHLPSYPMANQSQNIMACMALCNFIRKFFTLDQDFAICVRDESYVPTAGEASSQPTKLCYNGNTYQNMNVFHDSIADGLFNKQYILLICNNEICIG